MKTKNINPARGILDFCKQKLWPLPYIQGCGLGSKSLVPMGQMILPWPHKISPGPQSNME